MRFIDPDGMITGEAQTPEDYSKPNFDYSDGYTTSSSAGTTGAVSFEGAYLGSGGGDEGGSAESAGSTGNGPGDPPSKALLIYSTLEKPTDYNSHHHSPFKNRFKKGGFWDFLFNKMLGGPAGMIIPSPMATIESAVVVGAEVVGAEVVGAEVVEIGVNSAAKAGVQYSDDLVKAAQQAYPKLAGRIQLHHPIPQYLGGAKNQVLVPLDAAYHQQITNAFRAEWGYGIGKPTAAQLETIMNKVYSQFPLPK